MHLARRCLALADGPHRLVDHAWEATDALKAYLGEYYTSTDENMFVSLWKNFKSCRFVEDGDEVVFCTSYLLPTRTYFLTWPSSSDKDALGRAQRRVVYASVPSDSGVELDADVDA